MVPVWLAALLKLVADFFARWASDARRDEELKEAGRVQQREADAKDASAAERRSAEVRDKSASETIKALDRGEF